LEKFAIGWLITKAGTLDSFEFNLGLIAQAPTNGLKVSFQDKAAVDLEPDGGVDQYRVIASGDLNASAWNKSGKITSDGTDNGTQRVVSAGDYVYAVIEFESFAAGDDVDMGDFGWTGYGENFYAENAIYFIASWASTSTARQWPCALKYTDGTYAYSRMKPVHITGSTFYTYHSGSTPDEHAMVVTIPAGLTIRATGVWLGSSIRPLGAADLVLYDDNDNVINSAAALVDNDLGGLTSAVTFASPITLGPGKYRVSFLPTQAIQTVQIATVAVDSNGLLDALYGGEGTTGYHSYRTNLGAWTDETTKILSGGIFYDAVDTTPSRQHWRW
jgi:hypothetical protein